MNQPRPRVYVYRGAVPFWLVLAVVAPLGLVFLSSLVLALVVGGAVATLAGLVLPNLWKRPGARDANTIELDSSQYHRIESRPRRDRTD